MVSLSTLLIPRCSLKSFSNGMDREQGNSQFDRIVAFQSRRNRSVGVSADSRCGETQIAMKTRTRDLFPRISLLTSSSLEKRRNPDMNEQRRATRILESEERHLYTKEFSSRAKTAQ